MNINQLHPKKYKKVKKLDFDKKYYSVIKK